MKVFFGMLVIASLLFCLDAERRPKGPKEKGSGTHETPITIAFLLDSNAFLNEDAARNSTVGNWLNSVLEKAQQELNKEFQMKIKFNITDINMTDITDTQKCPYFCARNVINAKHYMDYLKQSYESKVSPDMICVVGE
ncbi:uncharacterized protein LOC115315955 [Ixodes scapularis]|uniref:uncharacterized protein LOC115315955 n=1 Tax=Ixodes scapularis TaxID=6945 RepID=UPI001A9EBD0D|nr:uncharacterized protein LOC115315955 [Ixodes scapularis]